MMASTSAGSGWTTGRIIALAAGSVLLLISLAFIAGGGTLAWADQEQAPLRLPDHDHRHVLHQRICPGQRPDQAARHLGLAGPVR